MTFYEFDALNGERQAKILWERSVYLMVRQEHSYKFARYQLHSYVGVWYHTNGNEIISFRSFLSPDPLEPYLEEIALPEILERENIFMFSFLV